MKRVVLVFCIMSLYVFFPMEVSAQEKETELTDGFVSVGIEDDTGQNGTREAGGEESLPASDTTEESDEESEADTGSGTVEENQPDSDGVYEESSDTDVVSSDRNQVTDNAPDTERNEICKKNDINAEQADNTALTGEIADQEEKAEFGEDELELSGNDEAGSDFQMPDAAKDVIISEKDNGSVRESRSYVLAFLCLGVIAVTIAFGTIKRNANKRK